jgi:hypothetical protein
MKLTLNSNMQGLQQQQQAAANLPLSSAAALTSASVPVVALIPHLQNALHLGIMQQVLLSTMSYVWSRFLISLPYSESSTTLTFPH